MSSLYKQENMTVNVTFRSGETITSTGIEARAFVEFNQSSHAQNGWQLEGHRYDLPADAQARLDEGNTVDIEVLLSISMIGLEQYETEVFFEPQAKMSA